MPLVRRSVFAVALFLSLSAHAGPPFKHFRAIPSRFKAAKNVYVGEWGATGLDTPGDVQDYAYDFVVPPHIGKMQLLWKTKNGWGPDHTWGRDSSTNQLYQYDY